MNLVLRKYEMNNQFISIKLWVGDLRDKEQEVLPNIQIFLLFL